MSRTARHLLIPLVFVTLFSLVAASPVELLGCRNRGLIAVGIALVCGLAGIATGIRGLSGKIRGEMETHWWMASTVIFALPAAFIVIIAR